MKFFTFTQDCSTKTKNKANLKLGELTMKDDQTYVLLKLYSNEIKTVNIN